MNVHSPVVRTAERRRRASGSAGERLATEAAILSRCRHPGVVELRSAEVGEGGFEITTAVPVGVPLREAALMLEEIAAVLAITATTISDLHSLGVSHGALTLDAVILASDGRPVIDDFSSAKWLDGPSTRWSAHPLARADDRALGDLLGALVAAAVPPEMIDPRPARSRRRPLGAMGRPPRAPSGTAGALARWASSASTGRTTSSRLADALAEEIPGVRLPSPDEHLSRSGREQPPPTLRCETPVDVCPADPEPPPAPAASILHPDGWLAGRWLASACGIACAVAACLVLSKAHPSGAARPAQPAEPPSIAPRPPSIAPRPPDLSPGRPGPAPPPVAYADGVVTVGADRFSVGRTGDVAAVGRWHCALVPTLALLRPSTGEVWTFAGWPSGTDPDQPTSVGNVAGAVSVSARAEGPCDALVVHRASGPTVEIRPWLAG
jgi:serine/threonine protein kinase